MSTLTYNVDHLISTTANDISVNANAGFDINNTEYDAAFFFVGKDIFSGNYSAHPTNADLISSNISINEDNFNSAAAFLIDSNNAGGLGDQSAYGQAARIQLPYTTTSYSSTINNGEADLLYTAISDMNSEALIPMILQVGDVPDVNSPLPRSATNVGQALLNAVSQALFKSLGNNVAINNDAASVTSLTAKLHDSISNTDGTGIAELSNNTSLFFQRYLDSGRYQADVATAGNTGNSNYNMDNVEIRFKLALSGSVVDSDSNVNLQIQANSRAVFGNEAASETLVNNGAYTTNLLIVIRQDSRI